MGGKVRGKGEREYRYIEYSTVEYNIVYTIDNIILKLPIIMV